MYAKVFKVIASQSCDTLLRHSVYTIHPIQQVALLWQRDRATRLSVEILQLQNIAIVWHYLRDPTFSHLYTIPKCDRYTHRQMDGQIHDNSMYCA